MMETTAAASPAPSFPIGISPADLVLGQEVDVESRTWAGINKPGGHATVIKIHADEHGVANRVDVKYVLGGRELNVELTYVKAHIELSRGSRGRRRDVKMNLGTLGGAEKGSKRGANKKGRDKDKNRARAKKKAPSSPTKNKNGGDESKKRKALASLDGNRGKKAKVAKKIKKEDAGEESSKDDAKVAKKNSHYTGEEEPKTDIDGNGSDKEAMMAKKSRISTSNAEEEESSAAAESKAVTARKKGSNMTEEIEISKNDWADLATEETDDGKWTFIQDRKISDHVAALQKGTRVSYWWSDEDGWLPGTVSKGLAKVVTPSTIKWTIKVDFDNGDRHVLPFHPREKRWKFLASDEEKSSLAVATAKEATKKKQVSAKKPTAKKQASKKKSARKRLAPEEKSALKQPAKPVGEKTEAAKPKLARKIMVEKDDRAKAAAKSSAAMNSITAESFSACMAKEVTGNKENKATDAANSASAKNCNLAQSFPAPVSNAISQTQRGDDPPPAFSFGADLRSRIKEVSSKIHNAAALAKVTQAEDAGGTLSPDGKKMGLTRGMDERAARTAAVQSLLIRPRSRPAPQVVAAKQSKGSIEYAESLKKASSVEGAQRTVMQSLYKSECAKAEKFVNFMTGNSSKTSSREKSPSTVASGNKEGDDLELKLEKGRMEIFNSYITDIMFRQRVDTMYVEEILAKVNRNADSSKKKPFTLLEIKHYLQKLHDDSRIFLSEEEGTMVIYSI